MTDTGMDTEMITVAQKFLRKKYRKLCQTCHQDKGDPHQNHIDLTSVGAAKMDHDIEVNTCSNCHYMHFSENKLTRLSYADLCISCHKDKNQSHQKMLPVADTSVGKVMTLDHKTITCTTCHKLHGKSHKEKFVNK